MEIEALCEDYRSFYSSVAEAADTTRALPRLQGPARDGRSRIEQRRRESERAFWGVARLFGKGAFDAYHADLEHQFWHPAFLRFGYVVALGRDGDPIVQARAGKHAGRVFLTDHNFYLSWEEQLVDGEDLDEIEDELAAVGFTSLEQMTADQFFDLMTIDRPMDGLFVLLAASFDDFYARCCEEYGAA